MPDDIQTILHKRYSRRGFLSGLAVGAGLSAMPMASRASAAKPMQESGASRLAFKEVSAPMDAYHHLAESYEAQILMRWGDAVMKDAPAFDPHAQSVSAQRRQFGYNNDYIAFFPINGSSKHGLLCVNHEYTSPELMFPGNRLADAISDAEHAIEMAAHGCSVLEVKQDDSGAWKPVYGEYNRRITASTPMAIRGSAAGDARMRTSADPEGRTVRGTFANCAGGQTPWRTYLTCEENVDGFFTLNGYDGAERANHDAMTMGVDAYHRWDKIDPRFDISREPNEPNRFGWVVEIDPFAPDSQPVKRTALGRFKHESATPVLNVDGRVVVYSGDDAHFEHLYKFVSRDRFQRENPEQNTHLLDHGTLYAARFEADGRVKWLALVHGNEPLTAENGFASQADVLIESRRAARLLGATPMDRPEDVEVSPKDGRVYVALTKNPKRETTDAVNRRAPNPMGYVLELIPPGSDTQRDHAAEHGQWALFLEGGDPAEPAHRAGAYGEGVSEHGWLACPDNLAFDPDGHLWITTDGQNQAVNRADGVYATATSGAARARTKCFFRAPIGAEMTGPCFTPDGETLFVSVQHPGERSGFDNPSTRWPDFDPAMPPRSAVVAITKKGGGRVGS